MAYHDVLNLSALIHDLEQSAPDAPIYELAQQGQQPEVVKAFDLQSKTATLHRALIEFCCIYLVVLLHELKGTPTKEFNVGHFCRDSNLAPRINDGVLLAIHCLYVFRNKLVVHHDLPRQAAVHWSRDRERRLMPAPLDLQMRDEDRAVLEQLRGRYGSVPGLQSLTNDFNLLDKLFHSIPPWAAGKWNPDRTTIDEIAERGGCKSPTADETVRAICAFTLSLADVVPFQR